MLDCIQRTFIEGHWTRLFTMRGEITSNKFRCNLCGFSFYVTGFVGSIKETNSRVRHMNCAQNTHDLHEHGLESFIEQKSAMFRHELPYTDFYFGHDAFVWPDTDGNRA